MCGTDDSSEFVDHVDRLNRMKFESDNHVVVVVLVLLIN